MHDARRQRRRQESILVRNGAYKEDTAAMRNNEAGRRCENPCSLHRRIDGRHVIQFQKVAANDKAFKDSVDPVRQCRFVVSESLKAFKKSRSQRGAGTWT